MEIYAIIYGFLLLSIFLDNKNLAYVQKKYVLILWVIVLTLFRGLRWRTGTDWEQFYDAFRYTSWDNVFNYVRYGDSRLEFGYVILNLIVKGLGGDYTVFLLLTNLFILWVYAWFSLKNSSTPILVFVIILFTTPFFPTRQLMAAAIVLLSYNYIINRSFLKFVVLVAIASTIHTSALIFLPFYFLFQIRVPSWVAVGTMVLVIIASTPVVQRALMNFALNRLGFLGDMVVIRLRVYMDFEKLVQTSAGNSMLSNLLSMAFLFLFSFLRTKSPLDRSETYNISYNAYLMYFCVSEFFRNSMEQMARNSNYFAFGFPLMLAIAVSYKKVDNQFKPFIYAAFVLYMIYKFYNTITYHYPSAHVPYRSVFD